MSLAPPGGTREERRPCIERGEEEAGLAGQYVSNGRLLVDLQGGLNQQRRGVANIVVLASILNATLVVPRFVKNPVWRDKSAFGEIFDVNHFIRTLRDDIKIERQYTGKPLYKDFVTPPKPAPPEWYLENMLPALRQRETLWVRNFYRQLPATLPIHLQKLRCRAQYRAMRFVPALAEAAGRAVAALNASGPYIAVHLRFEPDEVAFMGCAYSEPALLDSMAAFNALRLAGLQYAPVAAEARMRRKSGFCPLTPGEVATLLQAAGAKGEKVYLAGGEVAGGEAMLRPLRDAFPGQVFQKQDLIGADQLAPFLGASSKLAAIDYIVCFESNFLMLTTGGNMGMMLRGHRYFEGGDRETFHPYMRPLVSLLDQRPLDPKALEDEVASQRRRMNTLPLKWTNRQLFFDRPFECVCKA